MIEAIGLMSASVWRLFFLFTAGFLLGGAYFGGLWLTLRRLPRWRHPFLSMGLSLLVRLTVLLGIGGWLLRYSTLSPLLTILLMSAGVWLSRMVMIARLLAMTEPTSARSSVRL